MKPTALTILSRLALFTLLWLPLAGTRLETPFIGALAIAAATASSLMLWPTAGLHLRWRHVPDLARHFLFRSLLGGCDVARRVFSRRIPIQPAFLHYHTSLRTEAGRVTFVWMIGMMPGTASVDLLLPDRITVHAIDARDYNANDLHDLETKIAAVFNPSH